MITADFQAVESPGTTAEVGRAGLGPRDNEIVHTIM